MKGLKKTIKTYVMEKRTWIRFEQRKSLRTLHANPVWSKSVMSFRWMLHRNHDITQLNICIEIVKIYVSQQKVVNPKPLLHKSVLVGGRRLPVLINWLRAAIRTDRRFRSQLLAKSHLQISLPTPIFLTTLLIPFQEKKVPSPPHFTPLPTHNPLSPFLYPSLCVHPLFIRNTVSITQHEEAR